MRANQRPSIYTEPGTPPPADSRVFPCCAPVIGQHAESNNATPPNRGTTNLNHRHSSQSSPPSSYRPCLSVSKDQMHDTYCPRLLAPIIGAIWPPTSGAPPWICQRPPHGGSGGVGKTALAVEYAYRHRSQFDTVWWVRAEEPTTLVDDCAELASAVGLAAAAEAPVAAHGRHAGRPPPGGVASGGTPVEMVPCGSACWWDGRSFTSSMVHLLAQKPGRRSWDRRPSVEPARWKLFGCSASQGGHPAGMTPLA